MLAISMYEDHCCGAGAGADADADTEAADTGYKAARRIGKITRTHRVCLGR